MTEVDHKKVSAGELRAAMTALAAERAGKAVDPMEVAVSIAGRDEKVWRRLMPRIRTEAARLAKAGAIVVLRKGKPSDPERIRGLWRFRQPVPGEVLPDFKALRAAEAALIEDEDDED